MQINRQRQLPGADFTNPRLVALPSTTRHLATALRMMADPAGRGIADAALIRSRAWPAGPEGAEFPTVDEVETWLLELDDVEWLRLYPDPGGLPVEYFQIIARWPKVQKEGETRLPEPHDPSSDSDVIPPFLTAAVGGVGERESAGVSGGASERERAGLAGFSTPKIRIPPPPFCSMHRGGPPEGVDCRDCGTARNRNQQHRDLRTARKQAEQLPPLIRAASIAAIDDQIEALEEAAAPRPPSPPDPDDHVDDLDHH